MTWLWNLILYSIPWYVQTAIVALFALVILYLLVRIFGFERVKGWIPAVLAVVGAVALLSRQRQAGYADRKVEEKKAEDKAETVVEQKREEAKAAPDTKLDKEVDKWSRK